MVDSITGYLAPPTDEEEMRALAERLRGRSLGGQMLSLSGDPVLRGAGETGVARADMEAKQAGVLTRALEERNQQQAQYDQDALWRERQLIEQEAGKDRRAQMQASAEQAAALYGLDLGYETQLIRRDDPNAEPITAFLDKTTGQYRTPAPGGQPGMVTLRREDYEEALSPAELEKGMTGLREDIGEAQSLMTMIEAYDERFSPYAEGGEKPTPWGTIPGTEFVRGKSNPVADAIVVAHGALGGPEGEEYMAENQLNKAVLKQFRNLAIREQSGLTQTKMEIDKIRETYGERWYDDPAVQREAVRRLKMKFQEDLVNMGMRSSQVLNEYRSKQGEDQGTMWDREVPILNFPEASRTASGRSMSEMKGAARDPQAVVNPHLQRVLDMQQTRKPLEEMTVEELEAYNASLE